MANNNRQADDEVDDNGVQQNTEEESSGTIHRSEGNTDRNTETKTEQESTTNQSNATKSTPKRTIANKKRTRDARRIEDSGDEKKSSNGRPRRRIKQQQDPSVNGESSELSSNGSDSDNSQDADSNRTGEHTAVSRQQKAQEVSNTYQNDPLVENEDDEDEEEEREEPLKIRMELDLEAEVDLKARIQGDVTIGLWYVILISHLELQVRFSITAYSRLTDIVFAASVQNQLCKQTLCYSLSSERPPSLYGSITWKTFAHSD